MISSNLCLLILETSTEKSSIIFRAKDGTISTKNLNGGPELSKNLSKEVASLIKRETPDLVAVGVGPGSFTGIRVGAALAKGLSFGWKVPLISFCSLKAFAPSSEGPFAVVIDAKRGGFYTLFGENQNGKIFFEKPTLLSPNDPALNVPHIASPHTNLIQKRAQLNPTWHETSPNPSLLIQIVSEEISQEKPSPIEMIYLSSP